MLKLDGFYMEDYYGPDPDGRVTMTNSGSFKLRFAPFEVGHVSFKLHIRDGNGIGELLLFTLFESVPSNQGQNKGIRTAVETNYLAFDAGDIFLPIGQNIGWTMGNLLLTQVA